MKQPPPLPSTRRKSEWMAVLCSLAYPGTGQFFQGRRLVGISLTGVTTIAALWWLAMLGIGMWHNSREMLDGLHTNIFGGLRYLGPPSQAIGWCYLVSVLDALIVTWWRRRKAR